MLEAIEGIETMNAFSPLRLSDLRNAELFGLPATLPPARVGGFLARVYDRMIASWRVEPDLADMGPSQIHELLVMRGRD
jgi:hypothetical protein